LSVDGAVRGAGVQLVEHVHAPGRSGPAPGGDHQQAFVADLTAIGRLTTHAGRTTLRVSSAHGRHWWTRRAFARIGGFFARLRQTAEQLTPLERWYRILSEALVKYLKGRQLDPPKRLQMA